MISQTIFHTVYKMAKRKGKGSKCTSCGKWTVREARGNWKCDNCGMLCWSPFDRPRAGQQRKGYECYNCGNATVHPLGEVADVEVWRCSKCGTTFVVPKPA